MKCINGILIISDKEKEGIEMDIGPLTTYEVLKIRDKYIEVIREKEDQGYMLWVKLIRIDFEKIDQLCGGIGNSERLH